MKLRGYARALLIFYLIINITQKENYNLMAIVAVFCKIIMINYVFHLKQRGVDHNI